MKPHNAIKLLKNQKELNKTDQNKGSHIRKGISSVCTQQTFPPVM